MHNVFVQRHLCVDISTYITGCASVILASVHACAPTGAVTTGIFDMFSNRLPPPLNPQNLPRQPRWSWTLAATFYEAAEIWEEMKFDCSGFPFHSDLNLAKCSKLSLKLDFIVFNSVLPTL